jgi:hypothetical protein
LRSSNIQLAISSEILEIQKRHQKSKDNHNKWSEERKLAAWNKIAGKEDIPSSADIFKNLLGFGKKRKD